MLMLTINGEPHEIDGATTLPDLLTLLNVATTNLLVERNGVVLRADQFAGTRLADGDVLELVRLVGGG
jgi:thiamine biosynthesis protein ThiS